MLNDTSDRDFADLLGKLGAVQLDMLIMLREALFQRKIGPDFLRWAGTGDGKAAFEGAMARTAYAYRVSIAGASELLRFLPHPGIIPLPAVSEKQRFEPCMLTQYGVVEMTDRFRDLLAEHWIMPCDAVGVSPYLLQCPAPAGDIVLALGTRPYANCSMLMHFLAGANDSRTPLLTVHSNLFCMADVLGAEPCIVELWNNGGWHLDAHIPGDLDGKPLDPNARVFVPLGMRHKADEPV